MLCRVSQNSGTTRLIGPPCSPGRMGASSPRPRRAVGNAGASGVPTRKA